jgi:putative PIN family toxin of toxin-antitoxin system
VRVLIDANVLVSALLTRRAAKTSLVEWLVFVALIGQRRFELITSDPLVHEVRKVLLRRDVIEADADEYIDSLTRYATFVRIYGVPMGCPDPDDDMVLETALNANADVIVSRDGDLFHPRSLQTIKKTGIGIRDRPIRVLSVREFVDELTGVPRFSPLVLPATLAA